jgi:prepilin-type N-terminal cleavage/methylation domain-containing protein
MKGMMNNKGITLIELIIVATIIGILVVALGFEFQGWVSGYKVESQTKEMYIDLINTRARAMQKNRMHFIDLAVDQYNIYEDDNPAPNGDGIANNATDAQVSQRILEARYPIIWSTPGDTSVEFNTNGLSSDNKLICSNAPDDADAADYNCMIISTTRINMGKLTQSIVDGGACNAANCVER